MAKSPLQAVVVGVVALISGIGSLMAALSPRDERSVVKARVKRVRVHQDRYFATVTCPNDKDVIKDYILETDAWDAPGVGGDIEVFRPSSDSTSVTLAARRRHALAAIFGLVTAAILIPIGIYFFLYDR